MPSKTSEEKESDSTLKLCVRVAQPPVHASPLVCWVTQCSLYRVGIWQPCLQLADHYVLLGTTNSSMKEGGTAGVLIQGDMINVACPPVRKRR